MLHPPLSENQRLHIQGRHPSLRAVRDAWRSLHPGKKSTRTMKFRSGPDIWQRPNAALGGAPCWARRDTRGKHGYDGGWARL